MDVARSAAGTGAAVPQRVSDALPGRWHLLIGSFILLLATPGLASAREDGAPIRVVWSEGDVAGSTRIFSPDGEPIGTVDFTQRRRGDRLDLRRVAHFRDGSSDEDHIVAHVDGVLRALHGHSVIRDTRGRTTVDLTIDIEQGRINGFSGLGGGREQYDRAVDLPPNTYWGPLIYLVLKNFDANAEDGRLVFRTVAATPAPRVVDLELIRGPPVPVRRPGGIVESIRYTLRPTVNWLVDPIVQRIAPQTTFFIRDGNPPALAVYEGPRNFGGQEIRLE